MARIAEDLGIHMVTLYNWRKAWRLQGELVPASEKEPEAWSTAVKFKAVLDTAGLNDTELGTYYRERGELHGNGLLILPERQKLTSPHPSPAKCSQPRCTGPELIFQGFPYLYS